jgi:hypothetical protein
MSLSEWAKNDWLKAHKTSKREIDGLLSIVTREIADSRLSSVSYISYDPSLCCGLHAL